MTDRIIRRALNIWKLNIYLFPNLLKGDSQTRQYVLQTWVLNNFLFLNPIARVFQNMKLYSRLISIKNSKIELSETIESKYLIKNLDIVYINLKHRTVRKKNLLKNSIDLAS